MLNVFGLGNKNQIDQGAETEGSEMEGLEGEGLEGVDWRERVYEGIILCLKGQ